MQAKVLAPAATETESVLFVYQNRSELDNIGLLKQLNFWVSLQHMNHHSMQLSSVMIQMCLCI
ncbi:hypothetical protein D3C77_726400 [compost metagenome]